jgi:hypothetical protein
VGFFSHVDTEARSKALEAGCHHVLPRSKFFDALPGLLAAART